MFGCFVDAISFIQLTIFFFIPGALEKLDKPKGKKRQFDPLVSSGEKDKSLKILSLMASKKPKLDVAKGVGHHIYQEEQSRAQEKRAAANNKRGKGRKGGRGGGGRGGGGGGARGGMKAGGGRGGRGGGGGRGGRGGGRGRGRK